MGEWSAFGLDELIAVARDMKPSLIIDPSLAFEFEIPKKGDAYWRSLERSSGLPDRKSLNPAAIVSLLPNITLIDIDEESDGEISMRGRLAGQEFERVFGKIGGVDLREKFSPQRYKRWEVFARALLICKQPLRISTPIAHNDQTFLNGEFFIGPLQNKESSYTTLLGFAEFKPL